MRIGDLIFGSILSGFRIIFTLLVIIFIEWFVVSSMILFGLISFFVCSIFMLNLTKFLFKSFIYIKLGNLCYADVIEIKQCNHDDELYYLICESNGVKFKSHEDFIFDEDLIGQKVNVYFLNNNKYFVDTRTFR